MKTQANTVDSGERLKAFPLRSGARQRRPLSLLLLNILLEVLVRGIRQQKERKGIQIGKGAIKLYLKMT